MRDAAQGDDRPERVHVRRARIRGDLKKNRLRRGRVARSENVHERGLRRVVRSGSENARLNGRREFRMFAELRDQVVERLPVAAVEPGEGRCEPRRCFIRVARGGGRIARNGDERSRACRRLRNAAGLLHRDDSGERGRNVRRPGKRLQGEYERRCEERRFAAERGEGFAALGGLEPQRRREARDRVRRENVDAHRRWKREVAQLALADRAVGRPLVPGLVRPCRVFLARGPRCGVARDDDLHASERLPEDGAFVFGKRRGEADRFDRSVFAEECGEGERETVAHLGADFAEERARDREEAQTRENRACVGRKNANVQDAREMERRRNGSV